MEPQDAEIEDLRDHLLWQLNLTPMSLARPRDRGDDHRGDRRRRLPHRIGRSDPVEPRLAVCDHGRRDRGRAPSRAAFRSGWRGQPLAEGLPAACSSTRSMRRRRRSRSRETLVNEHLEALARQDRNRLCQRVHATEEEFEARDRADPLAGAQARRRLFERERRIRRAGRLRAQDRRPLARRARAGLPAAAGHQRALREPDRQGAPRGCHRTCAASCRKRAG